MTIKATEARQLCSAAEWELVQSSHPRELARATPARLRTRISRARRLRDKYRDLAARQRREARAKASPRGTRPSQSNQRTLRKAELFDQTLGRFEQRLEKLDGQAEREMAPVSRGRPTPARGGQREAAPAASRPGAARQLAWRTSLLDRAHGAIAGGKRNLRSRTPRARIKGHVSAQTRRAQARRDARRYEPLSE